MKSLKRLVPSEENKLYEVLLTQSSISSISSIEDIEDFYSKNEYFLCEISAGKQRTLDSLNL